MGKTKPIVKKTIVVIRNNMKYRLFDEDLKKIAKYKIKNIPPLPRY